MAGLIAIDEAFDLPELADAARAFAGSGDADRLVRRLADLDRERLAAMDAVAPDFAVLSLTAPEAQVQADPQDPVLGRLPLRG